MSLPEDAVSLPGKTMEKFDKYGLPGTVIGAQYILIAALLYVVVTALSASTKATTEMIGAVNRLTEIVKEKK